MPRTKKHRIDKTNIIFSTCSRRLTSSPIDTGCIRFLIKPVKLNSFKEKPFFKDNAARAENARAAFLFSLTARMRKDTMDLAVPRGEFLALIHFRASGAPEEGRCLHRHFDYHITVYNKLCRHITATSLSEG
jgi:hypothetical protein